MTVWAIESECEDGFYGYQVDRLYMHKEHAEEVMAKLAIINKGINYEIREWDVNETSDIEEN